MPAEEFTLPRFEVNSGADFLAFQMIMDFGRNGPDSCTTPVLNPEVTRVGISNKVHPKTKNLIQVLYVKIPLPLPLTPEQQ